MKKITILLIALLLGLSACDVEIDSEGMDNSPVEEQPEQVKEIIEESEDKDEVTEILKEYSSNKLWLSFQYPGYLLMETEIQHNKNGIVLHNEQYEGDMGFGWGEVSSGFKIMIKTRKTRNNWWDKYGKDHYGEIEGGRYGDIIIKEIIKIGDYEAAKRVAESDSSFTEQWKETHILTSIVIPHVNNNMITEISLLTKKSDNDKYINIFNNILESLELIEYPENYIEEFTIDIDHDYEIEKEEFIIKDYFKADVLEKNSRECGNNNDIAYYEKLLSNFEDEIGHLYRIKYGKESQDSREWIIKVMPDRKGYRNMDEFNNDFELCYAGGLDYPTLTNGRYLLFASSEGTGFDDGSGLPHGMDLVKEKLADHIILN